MQHTIIEAQARQLIKARVNPRRTELPEPPRRHRQPNRRFFLF